MSSFFFFQNFRAKNFFFIWNTCVNILSVLLLLTERSHLFNTIYIIVHFAYEKLRFHKMYACLYLWLETPKCLYLSTVSFNIRVSSCRLLSFL